VSESPSSISSRLSIAPPKPFQGWQQTCWTLSLENALQSREARPRDPFAGLWATIFTNTPPPKEKMMPRKPTPKPDDPEESRRFIAAAEKIGADDPDALDRALKKIAEKRRPPAKDEGAAD
jgi:hypothetical protein